MTPILISVAPNGARKSKADVPSLPITPDELAVEARRCLDSGVALFHLHVRHADGGHSLDPELYKQAVHVIRKEVGRQLILQISTETCDIFQPRDIIHVVTTVEPEAASIGVRDLIPDSTHEVAASDFLSRTLAKSVLIQYILYSAEDIFYFSDLIIRGIIPRQTQYHVLLVIGKKTGFLASPNMLHPLLLALKQVSSSFDYNWSLCAFGAKELDCMREAVSHGGSVRIGFENNHHLDDGSVAPHNGALIDQFRASLPLETDYFTASQYRSFCGL